VLLVKAVDLTMDCILEGKKSGVRRIVDEIEAYIHHHYNEEISLNSMAEKFYISPAYLSRMFKSDKGQNFNDFLSSVRMKKAGELLQNPELKMNDISHVVGMENVNYFLRKFKDYYGCTPSEYKKRGVTG
jgi:two-component system, response regulator YesN